MQALKKSIAVLSLTFGMTFGAVASLQAAPNGWQYDDRSRYGGDRYGDIRGLIDRTQADLHAASRSGRNRGDDRSRYENAQRHLSTFDRHITKGHFDKGQLDDAISDVKNILDKNTLRPEDRDNLGRDIQDLRAARERRY